MCSGGAASPRSAARRPVAPPPDMQLQQLQLQLPSPEFARVRKATYVSSSVDLKGCPPERYPEFAVIGRSNVGKSSLVNLLTGSDRLAKVSKEPGAPGNMVWCARMPRSHPGARSTGRAAGRGCARLGGPRRRSMPPTRNACRSVCMCGAGMTKTINHFLINDTWYLVDLPGYG
jgi:hypothetical protein